MELKNPELMHAKMARMGKYETVNTRSDKNDLFMENLNCDDRKIYRCRLGLDLGQTFLPLQA